jgi:hypothetical protein
MLTVMKLQSSKIRSFGSYLWITRGHDKTILLPKGVVETVAAKMVGISRDKAGLRLCINTMKQTVKPDRIPMPEKMRLDCIIYGSALAFVLTLKDEVKVFNELCSPFYLKMYSGLSSVLSLESPFYTWWCCGSRDYSYDNYNATVEEYQSTRSSVPGFAFDAKRSWPQGLPGYESNRPLRELRPGSILEGGERDKIDDKPQFYPICTVFSNYIPLVPYASINNETVSLANRALMVTPVPSKELWAEVYEFARSEIEKFVEMECELERDFECWNSKFTANKQRNHVKAWKDLGVVPLNKKDFIRKHFVKRELTMKGGEVSEDFDPRAIQANTDRLNVSLGPFIAKASEQLKAKWHAGHRICYTSGMTGEDIGAWRQQFGNRKVTIVECDESRYDAHQGAEAYQLSKSLCEKMGIEHHGDSSFALTSMRRINGWSSHGVKYSVDYTMTSGSPTTSFSNTFVNGIKTSFALERAGIMEYRILVHGDDVIIVLEGHMTVKEIASFRSSFRSHQARLGFETKIKISHEWTQIEYCSSLFWPVAGGYVLGPKIGKRLPKIGFSLQDLDLGEVKGMLLGLSIEAGFVPVLRVYAKHQLSLLRRVAKKTYYDKRSLYKSFATTRHECNEDTAYFFLERYGFSMEEAETLLSECLTSNLTDCVDYPHLCLFTAIDL